MSEKRFFKAYFTKQIIDKVTDKCYPIRDGESIDELVDLLNEQQATIHKLQDLCGESDSENARLMIENKRLQEENEQLEKEVNLLKPTNLEQYEQIVQLQDEIVRLEKINSKIK